VYSTFVLIIFVDLLWFLTINPWQKGPIIEHIQQVQKLNLKVKNILEDNLLDLFMGTLKEKIQHEVHLFEPKSLEHAFSMARKLENKNMDTRKVATRNYRCSLS
jgi:hypothetical protein